MKRYLILLLIFHGILSGHAQNFGVIADSIRINLIRDSLDQFQIDSIIFSDSLYASQNSIVNWRKDSECSNCSGKYCMVRKNQNGDEDLDFCNSGIPYIPVFQEYFDRGIDPLIWNSAKSQEYSHMWGTLYTPTYPDGFGYYDHQRCDYFTLTDPNYKRTFSHNNVNYSTSRWSVYNPDFPNMNSYAERNEKAASNNTIQQWYQKENAVTDNSKLKLYTKYEPNLGIKSWYVGDELPAWDENSNGVILAPGGGLTKQQTYSSSYFETTKYFEYGMFQAKITVPNNDGLWPAFWLVGGIKSAKKWTCDNQDLYYEELDIFEFMGNEDDKMITTIHAPTEIDQVWSSTYKKTNYFLHPHVYTCYWTECGIWVFLDEGNERKKVLEYHHYPGVVGGDCKIEKNKKYYQNLRYPTQPMKMVFNTAVYSCQNLKPTTSGFPVSMDVEWVKVFYQRPCIELKEISSAIEVNGLNQELFNVWSAKNVKIVGNESFLLQADNLYDPSRRPLLKVIVENSFEIASSVEFEIGDKANFYVEFSENICQNYGLPPDEQAVSGSQDDSDKMLVSSTNTVADIIETAESKIEIYPNPASLYLYLKLGVSNPLLESKVEFIKLTGELISTFHISTDSAKFYTGNLQDGVYILRIVNPELGIVSKLVSIIK